MGKGGGGGGRGGGFSVVGLQGQSSKVGEALAATAKVGKSKVWFNFGGNIGTVTWDFVRDKWYGSSRLVPQVKQAFNIPS